MNTAPKRKLPALGAWLLCALVAGFAHADDAPRATAAVVASQGGARVTLADVDAAVQRVPEGERAHFVNNPRRVETIITGLLLRKQLAAAARTHGLDKDPEVLQAKDGPTDEVLASAELARFKKQLVVPDFGELAREEYVAHKEKYVEREVLDVRHVLVTATSRGDDEAQRLAAEVEAEARKDPSRFDALVDKYSDDSDKRKESGLLRNAGDERRGSDFAAAARALEKPGGVSPVVKTSNGYEVLQLVAKAPARQKTFDEARDTIVADLRSTYVDKAVKERLDTLRNQPIDADADLVASLRTRYGVVEQVPGREASSALKP